MLFSGRGESPPQDRRGFAGIREPAFHPHRVSPPAERESSALAGIS